MCSNEMKQLVITLSDDLTNEVLAVLNRLGVHVTVTDLPAGGAGVDCPSEDHSDRIHSETEQS